MHCSLLQLMTVNRESNDQGLGQRRKVTRCCTLQRKSIHLLAGKKFTFNIILQLVLSNWLIAIKCI